MYVLVLFSFGCFRLADIEYCVKSLILLADEPTVNLMAALMSLWLDLKFVKRVA